MILSMTQDERWMAKWNIAKGFIETNRRNPSKFDGAEREIRNWIKHNRKLYAAGLCGERKALMAASHLCLKRG